MSASVSAGDGGAQSAISDGATTPAAALRIAVLDRDSGFIQVLSKRLDRLAWEHRVLASPVPALWRKLCSPPAKAVASRRNLA